MNRRFWCILCSFFLAYNLKVLFDDFYSVNYKIVEEQDELYDELTNIVACTHSNWIAKHHLASTQHNGSIRVKPEKVDARRFLNVSIAIIEHHLGTKNLFEVDRSYIFRDFLCFTLNQTSYENDPVVKNFLVLYSSQLFAYSPGKWPFFYEYVYNNYHNNDSLKIIKQKVYGPRYLVGSSNCRTPQDQLSTSNLNCLRKCSSNAPADLHTPDSDQLFDLGDFLDDDKYDPTRSAEYHSRKKRNVSIDGQIEIANNHSVGRESSNHEAFRKCAKKCPKDDCFSETYQSITVKNERAEISIENVIYRAYYSTAHFWLQLFGLLTLFTGVSFISVASHLMCLVARKLKPSHQIYFDRFFPRIKLGLLLFSAIFVLAQSILAIIDYNFEKSFPNRTIIWTFSSEPFSLFICLPIETLIYNDTAIEKGGNWQLLDNLTFEELENKTGKFENGVEEIRLLHGNRMKNLNWTMSEKVLFKNSTFDQLDSLSRCFRIELHFDVLKYRRMMPFHYLVIKFRSQFREVYLTERHQNFSSGLVDFKGDYFVRKTTEKALPGSRKANCRETMKESRSKQIDRCINQINRTIEHSCMETYGDRKSCNAVRFEESMKRMNFYDNQTIRLNLNYEHSISQEIDQSAIKLVLHILNLESIFFKNNVASCLLFLAAFLNRTFKLNWSAGKLGRYLVLSVCFFGFLTHSVFVFQGIIDEELAQNGYFKVMSNFRLPNAVFCFDLSKFELDENHRKTGDYLNNITKELRFGKIVEKIMWFNGTHDNVLRPKIEWSNYSNSEITISSFYLLDSFRCLEFQLNVRFDEQDFWILHNKFILRVYFKKSFTERNNKNPPKTHLFYRQSGQKESSDLLEYEIQCDKHGLRPIYEIVLEQIEVSRVDEFENLKDPRRLLFGKRKTSDVNDYLNEMQEKFSDLENLATNEILPENVDFSREIDKRLFKQLFFQVTNDADHRWPTSLNSNLTFFNFYSKRIDYSTFSFFQFTILPLSKRVEILNKSNIPKLIQDVLIALSLWFNTTMAELLVYVNLFPNVSLKFWSLLVKIQSKLSSFRETQSIDEERTSSKDCE